ncbi:hypothetical protein CUMW_190920 [Citrus unshiu]|nr:hypothetical protein CUMW_190920 [Citrus unshiu]
MALVGKMETEVEIKSPADKFYNTFSSKAHTVPNMSPGNLHGVEVHEGDWESHGSVKSWTFSADGTVEKMKEKVELDPENKTVTMVVIEGDLMKHFKSYKVIIKVIPKSECSLVKWIWEYEKLQEDGPTPSKYVDFVTDLTKNIDAHLLKEEQN